jgi:hypothetical protein
MPLTPDEIIETVNRMETNRSNLHQLMDGAVDLYDQKPYIGEGDMLDGYALFTSSNPTTEMDMALHIGSTAERIISVKEQREIEQEAETNNISELFALGAIKSADELRANLLMPDMQSAGYGMSCFRGRISRRVLLRKEFIEGDNFTDQEMQDGGLFNVNGGILRRPQQTTRTYVEILDWDPRNVYFELGKNGLEWACEKSWKSRSRIIAEFGTDPEADSTPAAGEEKTYAVYDYFDKEINMVIME